MISYLPESLQQTIHTSSRGPPLNIISGSFLFCACVTLLIKTEKIPNFLFLFFFFNIEVFHTLKPVISLHPGTLNDIQSAYIKKGAKVSKDYIWQLKHVKVVMQYVYIYMKCESHAYYPFIYSIKEIWPFQKPNTMEQSV